MYHLFCELVAMVTHQHPVTHPPGVGGYSLSHDTTHYECNGYLHVTELQMNFIIYVHFQILVLEKKIKNIMKKVTTHYSL